MEATGFAVAIMAAGKGTRLNSKRPKVLHEVGGRALLLHVIAAAETLVPAKEIYCIVGHQAERVEAAAAATGVSFVPQPDQRGTGHAMQAQGLAGGLWRAASKAPACSLGRRSADSPADALRVL
jgi:bifunctional UDP-N-acetylglucosamine pyrophosphorylase/glucosamine-1-phosphate N-acetyltransferase